MNESTKTITWQTLLANVAPTAETYTVRRITNKAERMYNPPPAGITIPRDLDADRLRESIAALPTGLSMEFKLKIATRTPAFYLTKRTDGLVSHWATFALHIDPIYGENTTRQMPRNARKWLGRTPWATTLMIAHEVPAWCLSAYADPQRLPTAHLVSDVSNLRVANIDPVLYGVVVAGRHWAFVPLAAWNL